MRKVIGNKSIITKVCRMQAYNSIMHGYFCIGFIDFMLKDKSLSEYANSLSPEEYKENDKITLKYFRQVNDKKSLALLVIDIENLK